MRVLVVDDHDSLRDLFQVCLSLEDDLELVGLAGDGLEAIDLAVELAPDAIVLDVELPVLDGIAALPALRRALPHATIVVFSAATDPAVAARAIASGATRYLVKDRAQLGDVISALREHGTRLSA
ncbi:MAG TPA: response regulator transcription factor [Egibacteraceae bacterium]|nr:response regulator transcription factor [Egibacteraceae bacterium]